jgi:hypothetical protein
MLVANYAQAKRRRAICFSKRHGLGRRTKSSVVAQDCILLYRGFPIRGPSAKPGGVENPAPSRLKIGDTADLEICASKNFVLHPHSCRARMRD